MDIRCVIDWPGTANFLKDIVVSAAASFTAVAAYLGLRKWRAEESGKADFELARRVGKSVYRFRDVLQDARRPVYWAYEFPEGHRWDGEDPRAEASSWAQLYNNRYIPVRDAGIELQSLCNEVEVLWGSDLVENLKELLRFGHMFSVAVDADLRNRAAGGDHFNRNPEFGKEINAQLTNTPLEFNQDGSEKTPNKFTKSMLDAVDVITSQVRSKLPSIR